MSDRKPFQMTELRARTRPWLHARRSLPMGTNRESSRRRPDHACCSRDKGRGPARQRHAVLDPSGLPVFELDVLAIFLMVVKPGTSASRCRSPRVGHDEQGLACPSAAR